MQRTRLPWMALALVPIFLFGCSSEGTISTEEPDESFDNLLGDPEWETADESLQARLDQTQTGKWVKSGALNEWRSAAVSVLLKSGEVLIIGGSGKKPETGEYPSLASAERYNPRTGKWKLTAPMKFAREGHQAVMLRDGRVLVVGGVDDAGALATAEVYDPAHDCWEQVGSLNTGPRAYHQLTLLRSGRVLVSGGYQYISDTKEFLPRTIAEIFDPRTNSFSNTGAMGEPRDLFTAVRLIDGRVLVYGGDSWRETEGPSTAEIYDPRTGTWRSTGTMTASRWGGFGVLLRSGKVLAAGGYEIGGDYAVTKASEVFNPDTETWTAQGEMHDARAYFAGVRLRSGDVLVAGAGLAEPRGEPPNYNLKEAEIFGTRHGTWRSIPSMNHVRGSLTLTVLRSGQVLAAGAEWDPTEALPTASDIFTP